MFESLPPQIPCFPLIGTSGSVFVHIAGLERNRQIFHLRSFSREKKVQKKFWFNFFTRVKVKVLSQFLYSSKSRSTFGAVVPKIPRWQVLYHKSKYFLDLNIKIQTFSGISSTRTNPDWLAEISLVTQVKDRYLKPLHQYNKEVFVLCYFPPLNPFSENIKRSVNLIRRLQHPRRSVKHLLTQNATIREKHRSKREMKKKKGSSREWGEEITRRSAWFLQPSCSSRSR